MCGFAGWMGPPDRARLDGMGQRLRHRGPDQNGVEVTPLFSLIHERLAILDLTAAGRQPMRSPDGRFVIVYNGEIYNYRMLRERYAAEGWVFRSQTDTECLLASVAMHGLNDLGAFHGMFACAIVDTKENKIFFARDRMGIKPLFWTRAPEGRLAFASEPGALLTLKPSWEIDPVARSWYFTVGYIPGPNTLFRGIVSLPPGRVWTLDGLELKEVLRFDTDSSSSVSYTFSEAKIALAEIVDAAVERQLVSDRPVGLFLSGGLDSTVILSAMRKARPHAMIKTFTTRFSHRTDDPKFNRDAALARLTAAQYGSEHHEIDIGPDEVIREAEATALYLGQPHQNSAIHAQDAAARLAAQHVTVVLSGDGGDESFGGYARYRLLHRLAPWLSVSMIRSCARFFARLHRRSSDWNDLLSAKTEAQRALAFFAPSQSVLRRLYGPVLTSTEVREDWEARWNRIRGRDPVSHFLAYDREMWLRDDACVRGDRLTMRHGLEMRVPLMDDAIIDFAAALPSSYHVTGSDTKRLWRSAFADRCLPDVLREPKRAWFPPTAKWMREELREWTYDLLEEAIRDHAWLDGDAVRELWESHLAVRAYRLNEIWTIVRYQLWWRLHRGILSSL